MDRVKIMGLLGKMGKNRGEIISIMSNQND